MSSTTTEKVKATLAKRYAREKRFRAYGFISIALSILFLAILLLDIFSKGLPAFTSTYIKLDVVLDAPTLGLETNPSQEQLKVANYNKAIQTSLETMFPGVEDRKQKKALKALVSDDAQYSLRDQVMANPSLIGTTQSLWLLADDDIDVFHKGGIDRATPEADRRIKDFQLVWLDKLEAEERIESQFNTNFFTRGDSREPEQAGILSALIGSFYTMLVTLLLSFPIGVAAAIYLEEFAPKNNFWVDLIEVNINNLAAVPSIVFGLLGLAVFIQFFGTPRSAPLTGGLVMTLLVLPTIIIASRAALRAVPPSIREGALGLGASKTQAVFQNVLPLAMPGILTGAIIGMAHALGETAPLLMIGMVAFIMDVPNGVTSPAAALPVQIFLWSDSPERAFIERTSAAIIVLLAFLILMNLLAVILRKKFERRW
ncbi:MAG TPA: phosphate ABC transporter permease PstA [Candidatus Thiothrix moscowensis]|uniref:phosphate ABC transporter permease PstA n=1 Tax=unclassified Thiothrix TaxID=2636184 RepID=UPI0025E184C5|nr:MULTISPECIES: phosphate ABC transporter permease PstA [unclassified Thiothrix]HRJ53659.1 phosphate ABC transporter permease PstA [Candidatus Thiothrix moscowensis]HRJ93741.1 phosphate ABC transporter permease PstA [Candidatus Thiothrix moscowensis]